MILSCLMVVRGSLILPLMMRRELGYCGVILASGEDLGVLEVLDRCADLEALDVLEELES